MIKKPMLAEAWNEVTPLRFPLLVTPKLDGIRTLIHPDRGPSSRSFLPVPNEAMLDKLGRLPPGLDGEVMVAGWDFKDISGIWRRRDGGIPIGFAYHVFDDFSLSLGYRDRMEILNAIVLPSYVQIVMPVQVDTMEELLDLEDRALGDGYEGLMMRIPDGPYHQGRATNKQQYLLKLKRFQDGEAEILGVNELNHNLNEPELDAFGRTKRSGHRANLTPGGTAGSLSVRDIHTGVEFNVGTGFDADERAWFWNNRESVIGELVNYRHQKVGADVKPRFPKYHGLRDKADL